MTIRKVKIPLSVIGRETPIRGDIIVFVVASFSSASGYIRFAIVESLGIKDVIPNTNIHDH